MERKDLIRALGMLPQPVDPNIPAGAYPLVNIFTGREMPAGWYLADGVCMAAYEGYSKGGVNNGSDNGV